MILAFCYKCSLRITHPSAKPPPRPRLPHRQTRRADPLFPRSPPPRPSCEVRYCFRVLGICPTQLNTAQHSWLVASGLCTVCSQRTPKNLRNLRDFRFLRDNCSAVQCSASRQILLVRSCPSDISDIPHSRGSLTSAIGQDRDLAFSPSDSSQASPNPRNPRQKLAKSRPKPGPVGPR